MLQTIRKIEIQKDSVVVREERRRLCSVEWEIIFFTLFWGTEKPNTWLGAKIIYKECIASHSMRLNRWGQNLKSLIDDCSVASNVTRSECALIKFILPLIIYFINYAVHEIITQILPFYLNHYISSHNSLYLAL